MIGLMEWVLQIVGIITFAIPAFIGALSYKKSVTYRRAQWLASLYRIFYERDQLKDVRGLMDSVEGRKEIEQIVKKELCERVKEITYEEEKRLSEFTDYLNFFEFMLYLKEMSALEEKDVKAMFDYHLRLFRESEVINRYIGKMGFLDGYLKKE